MATKKELNQAYKAMRPQMGVFVIRSKTGGACRLYAAQDLMALMNRHRFQLSMGAHRDRALQEEWSQAGGEGFAFEVVERLDYDKDEAKTDYSEELDLLRQICRERLEEGGETVMA